jgi:type I restriction enzyme M protein
MTTADLEDFVKLYNPQNRHKRYRNMERGFKANLRGRWRKFTYEEILARDKTNLDIFWLKDKSLTDLDNLPDPDILAGEIIENIESGLNSFKEVMDTINAQAE